MRASSSWLSLVERAASSASAVFETWWRWVLRAGESMRRVVGESVRGGVSVPGLRKGARLG